MHVHRSWKRLAASQLYFQNTYSFSMLRFIFNTVVVQTERQICEIHQNSNSSCSYHQCATHIIFRQVSFQDSLKPALRTFPTPKFSWGRTPRPPPPCGRGHPSHTHPSAVDAIASHLHYAQVLRKLPCGQLFLAVPLSKQRARPWLLLFMKSRATGYFLKRNRVRQSDSYLSSFSSLPPARIWHRQSIDSSHLERYFSDKLWVSVVTIYLHWWDQG